MMGMQHVDLKTTDSTIQKKHAWQFFVSFLAWLSDLQLGDEKVTLNHLVVFIYASDLHSRQLTPHLSGGFP